MTHESRLSARREEPDPQIVIGPIGLEDKGGVGIVEFARDRQHLRVSQSVGVQNNAGGIAGEFDAGKCIDLMDLNCARHGGAAPVCAGHGKCVEAAILCPAAASSLQTAAQSLTYAP